MGEGKLLGSRGIPSGRKGYENLVLLPRIFYAVPLSLKERERGFSKATTLEWSF